MVVKICKVIIGVSTLKIHILNWTTQLLIMLIQDTDIVMEITSKRVGTIQKAASLKLIV